MIRIARGPEPEELRSTRRARLSRAILARRAGVSVDFSGYEAAKDALIEATHYKCAFCEKDILREGNPVEHFRPKAFVENEGEAKDPSRYWWLAWTWENLLVACFRCNTVCKKNQFPLEPGASPLPELSVDLEQERPLLIDPARIDPRRHIRFRWSAVHSRWIAVPVGGSLLGYKTINTLKLDRNDDLQRHLEKNIEPWMEQLRDQMSRGDPQDVRQTWRHLCRALFAPAQAYHAFTWDVLAHHFPEPVRRAWELELPVLGRSEQLPPSPVFVDPPEMSLLPEEVQLRVRALGSQAPWEEVRGVLDQVLPLQPWTDEQLARLLGREEATIRDWKRRHSSASAS